MSPRHRHRGQQRRPAPPLAAAAAAPFLVAATLLLLAVQAQPPPPAPAAGTAVIIGAGLSGLAAADALCAKGFKVTILEGRTRAGGRTFTTRLPITNTLTDVGAGWLHDADPTRNSVAKFCADNSIATQTDDSEDEQWLVPNAPPAVAKIAANAQSKRWTSGATEWADLIDSDAEGSWSASQPLQKYFDDFLASKAYKGDDLAAVKKLAASDTADLELGATMKQIAARWAGEGNQQGGPEMVITKGYGAVLDALLTRISAQPTCRNALVLGAQAAEISVVSSPAAQRGVRVRLANGTTVAAKFGITTLPLGVLQKGGVKFTPPLTAAKTAAMGKLAMGLLDKVVLVYDRPFFLQPGAGDADAPAQVSWFQPITSASNPKPPADGEAFEFWNDARFRPGSNAVVMLVGADTARAWENASPSLPLADRDRLLAQRADALFRQLFPGAGPVLREYFVTRWATDPFTYGSYSYIPVGGSPSARRQLCAAQSNLLFWAGEHCSTSFPSTANGAFDTGVAAAKAAMANFTPTGVVGRR